MPACPKLDVGGQAVIEGVMMRSARSFAVVCRRPNGEIVVKEDAWQPVWSRLRFLKWPFLRGGVALLEAMVNGIAALSFSANQQVLGEAEAEAAVAKASGDGASTSAPTAKAGKSKPAAAPAELSKAAVVLMVITSIAMGMALFVGAPHLITWLLGFDSSSVAFHAVDGAIKMVILLSYLGLIGLMPDVRRVFQYHGAEHKAIYTYEQGLPLTVDNAREQTRFHPRCGTSFLLIVITTSIILFALVLRFPISGNKVVDNLAKIAIKIPLMFPVAGIAYEAIKLSGRFAQKNLFVRMLTAPGLLLQNLTTREPTDDQLEIALVSIRKTLWRERLLAAEAAAAKASGAVVASAAPAANAAAARTTAPAAPPQLVQVYRGIAEVDLPLA